MSQIPTRTRPAIHEQTLLKGLWPKLMALKALQPWLLQHERDFLEAQAKSVVEEGRVFNTVIVANWCDFTIEAVLRSAKPNTKQSRTPRD
jgi:hypothetical protein